LQNQKIDISTINVNKKGESHIFCCKKTIFTKEIYKTGDKYTTYDLDMLAKVHKFYIQNNVEISDNEWSEGNRKAMAGLRMAQLVSVKLKIQLNWCRLYMNG